MTTQVMAPHALAACATAAHVGTGAFARPASATSEKAPQQPILALILHQRRELQTEM
jgi:hypothetical protein